MRHLNKESTFLNLEHATRRFLFCAVPIERLIGSCFMFCLLALNNVFVGLYTLITNNVPSFCGYHIHLTRSSGKN
jgi:hypothetical protein